MGFYIIRYLTVKHKVIAACKGTFQRLEGASSELSASPPRYLVPMQST
jgi:hypothetical protein